MEILHLPARRIQRNPPAPASRQTRASRATTTVPSRIPSALGKPWLRWEDMTAAAWEHRSKASPRSKAGRGARHGATVGERRMLGALQAGFCAPQGLHPWDLARSCCQPQQAAAHLLPNSKLPPPTEYLMKRATLAQETKRQIATCLEICIFKWQDSRLSLKGQNGLPRSICNAGGVALG